MTKRSMPDPSLARKKAYRLTSSLVVTTLIQTPNQKQNLDYKVLKAQLRYPVTPTLADQKMIYPKQMNMVITEIWRVLPEILSGSSGLRLVMTWRI